MKKKLMCILLSCIMTVSGSLVGVNSVMAEKNEISTDSSYEETVVEANAAAGETLTEVVGTNSINTKKKYVSKKFTYQIQEDGTAKIIKYTGKAKNLKIPSALDGKKVTFIESLGYGKNVKALKTVQIPKTVSSIGGDFTMAVENLNAINVAKGNSWYFSDKGVLYGKNKKNYYLCHYPRKKTGKSYKILNKTTRINWEAFPDNPYLTNITVPKSVTFIEQNAFACKKLKKLTFLCKKWTAWGSIIDWGVSNLKMYGYAKSFTETHFKNENYKSRGYKFIALSK